MEPHRERHREGADHARERAWRHDQLVGEVGAPLRRRTPCAICRRVLLPAVLASVPHPDGWDGWDGGNGARGVFGRGVSGAADDWTLALHAALPVVASAATRYPAARAQRLAPRGYAVGAARGRWTGWVCAPCAERLTVEEHQVGAQRALERRVACLEQQLRLPVRSQPATLTSPTVQWPERSRADRTGRQQVMRQVMHSEQAPWIVSLEAYRAVRRDLRVCRQSLADLTATLASIAASDDPVLAWPPLYLPHPPAPLRSPTAMSDRKDRKHWGGTSRRPADALVPLLPPVALQGVEPVEWSDQELLSAGVQVCAPPVACHMRRCAAAPPPARPTTM